MLVSTVKISQHIISHNIHTHKQHNNNPIYTTNFSNQTTFLPNSSLGSRSVSQHNLYDDQSPKLQFITTIGRIMQMGTLKNGLRPDQ